MYKSIKVSEYDPAIHKDMEGYYSNRGTQLQGPSLKEDWRDIDIGSIAPAAKIERLQEALKKNPKVKAYCMILSGSRGGAESAWYRVSNLYIDVWVDDRQQEGTKNE